MRFLLIISCICICFFSTHAQDSTIVQLPGEFLQKTGDRLQALESKLEKKTEKALAKFQQQEQKLIEKIRRTDSTKAKQLYDDASKKYTALKNALDNPQKLKEYIPFLDTLNTSLNFLQSQPEWLAQAKGATDKLEGTMQQLKGFESKLQNAETIKQFLRERKKLLNEELSKFGFAKELKKLNKQAYYYGQQVNEYKAILKDPKRAERKALELLAKTEWFKDFMRKNSQLASLFRMPGDPNDPGAQASLAGLQTRAQVNQLVQQRIGNAPGGMQQFQQNLQGAQEQLNQLKEKLLKVPSMGGDLGEADMPEGFKPNDQKTKSFLKRLELGTNMQSQKANGFFPTTSDIGLSLGYKLNDKSILGIGASYKLGWGTGFRDIEISHQGMGLRSFIDWKLKGSFWISGGYEMNYRSEFENIDVLKDRSAWQQSGLVGMSKVISLKTKFFKKTKLQLLWDFLSYEQVPRTQPVVFRVGYNF